MLKLLLLAALATTANATLISSELIVSGPIGYYSWPTFTFVEMTRMGDETVWTAPNGAVLTLQVGSGFGVFLSETLTTPDVFYSGSGSFRVKNQIRYDYTPAGGTGSFLAQLVLNNISNPCDGNPLSMISSCGIMKITVGGVTYGEGTTILPLSSYIYGVPIAVDVQIELSIVPRTGGFAYHYFAQPQLFAPGVGQVTLVRSDVPEPSTWLLAALGIVATAWSKMRKPRVPFS